ncbi:MAG: SUMF1/EgtB/PvdO family nonheme iron enzyme [Candidatus Schekmanbacteria bacterium]|nr:SUMF1/EgtB/PvdO family nonheme iron enzyme [Candidatus Schekmanbacteria bacterium]
MLRSGFKKGERYPVEQVSWNDAVAFAGKLSTMNRGSLFRLPSEAEWEYAARGGTTGARYGELDAIAWHDDNSSRSTHPVGQKSPNAHGLYDMLGNVWEWTGDWYGAYISVMATNPTGPGSGAGRVRRGGGWAGRPVGVRRASRGGDVPTDWTQPSKVARGPVDSGDFEPLTSIPLRTILTGCSCGRLLLGGVMDGSRGEPLELRALQTRKGVARGNRAAGRRSMDTAGIDVGRIGRGHVFPLLLLAGFGCPRGAVCLDLQRPILRLGECARGRSSLLRADLGRGDVSLPKHRRRRGVAAHGNWNESVQQRARRGPGPADSGGGVRGLRRCSQEHGWRTHLGPDE